MEVKLTKNISINHAAELENYFVFYAFDYGDKLVIYITDKNLNHIKHVDFSEKGYFSSNFHQSEGNDLVFSVTTTGTSDRLPESKSYYQFFETHWYRLSIRKSGFLSKKTIVDLNKIEFWEKSEIKNIASKKVADKIYWVSDVQNISNTENRYKKNWSLQYAITNSLFELPKFEKIEIEYSGIKKFDFQIEAEKIYIAAIGRISWDLPLAVRFDIITKEVKIEELEIPLKKLHYFEDVKLTLSDSQMISFFNSASQEYSKKHEFRIYKCQTSKSTCSDSLTSYLNNHNFIRNVKWYERKNNLFISYAAIKESSAIRITEITNNEEVPIVDLENISTVFVTEAGDMIYSYVKEEPLKKTYLSKLNIKTTTNIR